MIQWIWERLSLCKNTDGLILATTGLKRDRLLATWARQQRIPVFCGSEEDVLDRYYHCAKENQITEIVRATGDNPFVDPGSCDRLIEFYLHNDADYATTKTLADDGFPIGVGVEVIRFEALECAWNLGQEAHHREHVNEYILERPQRFKIIYMPAPDDLCAPNLSLTVDTAAQFRAAAHYYQKYQALANPRQHIPLAWVVKDFKSSASQSLLAN